MAINTNFSNAVFTFLPPEDLPDHRFEFEEEEEEEDENFYYKAVEGSYDKSYFIDEKTKKFRFPNYNKDRKCLVIMKDITDYKSDYFSFLRKEERDAYNIDKFELESFYTAWEIEHFKDFLVHVPASYFDKGFNKKESLELFEEYSDFLNDEADADDYFEIGIENSKAFKEGFMELADKPSAEEVKDLWKNVPLKLLNELCLANDLPVAKQEKTCIKRLREKNIPFSFDGAKPSQLLKDYYLSFVDLYVEEVRKYIDHFHPMYLKEVWEQVRDSSWNDQVEKKIDEILKNPYWKDRLYKVEKPKEEDFDYGDDEDDEE